MKMPTIASLLDNTTVSDGKGPFGQQNNTPDRKLFIAQSKYIIF